MSSTENANRDLIARLYGALDRHDGDTMAACYAPDAVFEDPAFGRLSGEEAGDMWRMLTARAEDLHVDLLAHDADGSGGSAHWVAHYTFSATDRPVVNDVQASFRFRDGLIVEHNDRFSFWKWSRQAIGAVGLVGGWTPVMRSVFQKQARGRLEEFRTRS